MRLLTPFDYRVLSLFILDELVAVDHPGVHLSTADYNRLSRAKDAALAAVMRLDVQQVSRDVEDLVS